jgi:hypothetical protein
MDDKAIREQLERILLSPLFSNSKRYPALLRHVVEQTLEGTTDGLKERSLGVEVFGKDPDYDTNADHMVRSTASEIRKRLAQYYAGSEHQSEIRIDLPPGSYIPQFHAPDNVPVSGAQLDEPTPVQVTKWNVRSPSWRVAAWIAVGVTIIIVLAVAYRAGSIPATALDRFWAPVRQAPGPAVLVVGDGQPVSANPSAGNDNDTRPSAATTVRELHFQYSQRVPFSDVLTLSRLTAYLESTGKQYRISFGPNTAFTDLRQGPVILVGAFDNDWTIRLTGPLRYTFDLETERQISYIKDNQNPARRDWSVNWRLPYLELTKDYAIVSRVRDATTEEVVVVAGGMTKYGTMAAGEFLSGANHMDQLAKLGPRGWEKKNMQILLATRVIKGSYGPPRIVTAYFW